MKTSLSKLLGFYRNLPIRSKLILVLYIQILIPLILVGYLSFRNSEDILKDKSTSYFRDILNMIQLRLGDYMDNLTIISQDLLYEDKIYNVLDNKNKATDRLSSYVYENEINSLFKKVILSRNDVQSICLVTNDGTFYYADNNSSVLSIRKLLPYSQVLESARKGKGKPVWYVVSENNVAKEIYLARSVYNRDTYQECALLVLLVKKELFDSVYQDLTGNLADIAILSENNKKIAGRDPNDTYIYSDSLVKGMTGKKGEIIDNQEGTFVSYTTLQNTGWKVVAYITLDELYKDANTLRRNLIVLCAITVVLMSMLSFFMAFDFVNPINRLVRGMKKVQKGESNVYISDDRGDELGFLNTTFNEMSGEIHHLVNWVYREQLTRKEAELKALQSQINPHFLFNTLESINWMAQLNNVPEISTTVSDLSNLMEASIGRDDRLITVQEEFTYADKYISLVKRRFDNRIEMVKNISDEVLGVKIPRLLIQPLVENAVYHGIERNRGKGTINLNAFKKDGIVIIEVIDNGAGMEKGALDALNERLSMDNNTYFKNLGEKKRKSIGIENVNRRIKLFFGDSYGLRIESEVGKYTKATAVFPDDETRSGEGFYVQGIDH